MNTVFRDKVTTSVVTRVAGLFILAVVAIAFLATPMLSFAANPPQGGASCSGPSGPDQGPPQPPSATLVAAFSIKPGTNSATTLKRDPNFKPTTPHPPTTGIEIVEVKLNNKPVFGVYRGLGVVMVFQDTPTINSSQFVKIK